MTSADTNAFHRGEYVTFPVLVRDNDGGIIDIAGGTLTVEVMWRGVTHITLEEGDGLTILDESPAAAAEGQEQAPHATAELTDEQTALMPDGKTVRIRGKFVDSLDRVFLAPWQWLDDIVEGLNLDILLGGRQGPAGTDGADGEDGDDGEDGTAATIAVGSVTTLAAGSPATVENAGSANAAVLNFAIPAGQPGEDGADGETGPDCTIVFILDGLGDPITTGVKGDIGPFDFDVTVVQWTLLADVSGSMVVDLWRDSYANFPPTVADSICASAKPTISAAQKAQSSTLTGWTTAIPAGHILRVNVDSAATIERATLALKLAI